jgi:hypothetical protein
VQASGGATSAELHALASVATDQFRNSLSVAVSC